MKQKLLLQHLPTETIFLDAYYHGPDDDLRLLPPRDLDYEKLCALTKSARQNDLQLNPNDNSWLFAKAVTEFTQAPHVLAPGLGGSQASAAGVGQVPSRRGRVGCDHFLDGSHVHRTRNTNAVSLANHSCWGFGLNGRYGFWHKMV